MRIRSVTTKSGQTIELGHFTVLVGANNVGKSQTLYDIHARLTGGRAVILDKVEIPKPESLDDLFSGVQVDADPSRADHSIVKGIKSDLLGGHKVSIPLEQWRSLFVRHEDIDWALPNVGTFQVALLNAKTRLQVAEATESHDPHQQGPQRLLQSLYVAGAQLEARFRQAFQDTFKTDIKLDYSGLKRLYLRVASEFPEIPSDPREAYPIMRRFAALDEQGDGFRSFSAVVLSLLIFPGRTLLLDEPEAFLHPAQARQLGVLVAQLSSEAEHQVIVATHNAHFLAGVLETGGNVDIYRLNRNRDETRYLPIAPEHIKSLTTSPLLSSQRVLEAVFHRGVVVCEADSDRIYYQTALASDSGIRDIIFLHAHNKQSVHEVVTLLRSADIPTVAIVDIDILNSALDVRRLVEAFGSSDIAEIESMRAPIAAAVEGASDAELLERLSADLSELTDQLSREEHTVSGARSALRRIDAAASVWRPIKERGLSALPAELETNAADLLTRFGELGIFVVPVGELEGWADVGTKRKSRWIVAALRELRENGPGEAVSVFLRAAVAAIDN